MLKAFRMLFEVILVTTASLFIFAVYGIEAYRGTLRQKCVIDPATLPMPPGIDGGIFYAQAIRNSDNWFKKDDSKDFFVCGNNTGAGRCPHGYICLPDIGDNPNFGYCNFDNIGWSMLLSLQLFTLDYWENIFHKVVHANGIWTVVYFIIIVCFGSFYLMNVTLAVVATSYEDEAIQTYEEKEKELSAKRRQKQKEIYDGVMKTLSKPLFSRGKVSKELKYDQKDSSNKVKIVKLIQHKKALEKQLSEFERRREEHIKNDISGHALSSSQNAKKDRSQNCLHVKKNSSLKKVFVKPQKKQLFLNCQRSSYPTRQLNFRTHGLHSSREKSQMKLHIPLSNDLDKQDTISDNFDLKDKVISLPRPGIYLQLMEVDNGYLDRSVNSEKSLWETRNSVLGNPDITLPETKKYSRTGKYFSNKDKRLKNKIKVLPPIPGNINESHLRRNAEHFSSETGIDFIKTKVETKIEKKDKIIFDLHPLKSEVCPERRSPDIGSFVNAFIEDSWESEMAVDFSDYDFSPNKKLIQNEKNLNHNMGDFVSGKKECLQVCGITTKCKEMKNQNSNNGKEDEFDTEENSAHDNLDSLSHNPLEDKNSVEMAEGKLQNVDSFHENKSRAQESQQQSKTSQSQNTADNNPSFNFDGFKSKNYDSGVAGSQEIVKESSSENMSESEDFSEQLKHESCSSYYIHRIMVSHWQRLQNGIHSVVTYFFFEAFITICTAIYAIFLSTEHHGMSKVHEQVVDVSGYLRVLRIAKVWPAMNSFLLIIADSFSGLGNLIIIFIIVLYMFAVIGFQLFQEEYQTSDTISRWNFINFPHSFMMIFRVLCGEWTEPLTDCMRFANTKLCIATFLTSLIFGKFVVLNLFLALLLNSFGKVDSQERARGKDMRKRSLYRQIKHGCSAFCNRLCNNKVTVKINKPYLPNGHGLEPDEQINVLIERDRQQITKKEVDHVFGTCADKDRKKKDLEFISADESDSSAFFERQEERDVESGAPSQQKSSSPCENHWRRLRMLALTIVESTIYETIVILIIFASSASLAFEDFYLVERPFLEYVLNIMNIIFSAIFLVEVLLSLLAFGCYKYFTTSWTLLDFFVCVASLLNIFLQYWTSVSVFSSSTIVRSVRCLLALRPLRIISHIWGMKVLVNAIMNAIPAIINAFLVSLIFWIMFGVSGVELYAGMFYKCLDDEGNRLNHSIIPNRSMCMAKNYTWKNSDINFDNILNGFLALFQVATFEGWREIIEDAVDTTKVDEQPIFENSPFSYFFFIAFIICGSFIFLNIIVGVIINNFNALKRKYEGSVATFFLTPNQLKLYNTLKKMANQKPSKRFKEPQCYLLRIFFDLALSLRFDLLVMIVVVVEVGMMASHKYKSSCSWTQILDIANIAFATFFALEAIMKILGLQIHYFTVPWNVYDFTVAVLSVAGVISKILTDNEIITSVSFSMDMSSLRVLRMFRITRILRLTRVGRGIRKIVVALMISLPAVVNILALLSLFMFIYAIFGVSFFSNVKLNGDQTDLTNFRTISNATLLLLTLVTGAGWNDVLNVIMTEEPDCNSTHRVLPNGSIAASYNGDCGMKALAIPYIISYILIVYLVVANMFIAVILENYEEAHKEDKIGLTEDDFEVFYQIWQIYDPKATQFINYSQLSDFVADLEPPLGIEKPNEIALVSFNLPIMPGDKIHCLDILLALVKNVITDVEDSEEMEDHLEKINIKFSQMFPIRTTMQPVSNTLMRKKEDVAARTLQTAWRNFKTQEAMTMLMMLTVHNSQHYAACNKRILSKSLHRLRSNLAGALNIYFDILVSDHSDDKD
ncbi:sodium channel protein 1 brain-like isoform X3 [Pomacea canaliculata]|uniref:sodium channel protein 1 brain-like isoform X3 n=1 Tax=Pomacea canaliculata TaxID=400727 RepID=UPI000D73DE2D|nr:sodium channel protein 1 brain-like isoform X3 [Pomacea canaliculata]